jgi:hypothetical protein
MVLSRALCALLLVAGCGQSLFDSHGGRRDGGSGDDDDGGGGDGSVPLQCPVDSCIADAAADFTGEQGGSNGHWRYYEDRRNRTWATMAPGMTGTVDQRNAIKSCADTPSEPACKALSSALLISSADRASTADPAIEYRSFLPQVIQLAVRVRVDSAGHKVRLYRNSREDILFAQSAAAGETVMANITVDALANDRFLVALEPTDSAGGVVALQFFVIDAKQKFPQTCQVALPFTVNGSTATAVGNPCGDEFESRFDNGPLAPIPREDPFMKPNGAVYVEPDYHFRGTKQLDRPGAITVQFWALQENFTGPTPQFAWLFSDIDEMNGGGLGIRLRYDTSPYQIEASVLLSTGPATYAFMGTTFGPGNTWRFVRVIHDSGTLTLCMDGIQAATFPFPGPRVSNQPPYLGRNVIWDTANYLYGSFDDVRVFSGALPCD